MLVVTKMKKSGSEKQRIAGAYTTSILNKMCN